jgi:uncharacterized OB-fold protein
VTGLVLPQIDDANRPFWDGCREGVLRIQGCSDCGHLRYPISIVCPKCLSTDATWEPMSGRGEVYTFGIFRHAYNDGWRERVPYNVALVQLDEGPTLISNVVGIAPEALRVGLPVTVVFEAVTDEVTVPQFTPAEGGTE